MITFSEILNTTKEFNKFLSNKENLIVMLRLLKIEINHNLNLINCLKKDLKQQDEEFNEIINLLESSILQIYLTNQHRNDSLLSKIIDPKPDLIDLEKDDLNVNIILKIKILKSINTLPYKNKNGYKKFRLKQRIELLRAKMIALVKILDDKLSTLQGVN
jgi:hypothetical protein